MSNYEATCTVRIYIPVNADTYIEDAKEMMRETLRKAGIDYLEASITYGDFEIREN